MESIMLSIKPQYVEQIFSGKKTLEMRKNRPKIEPPFRCYIYETLGAFYGRTTMHRGTGMVVGEFICDKITRYEMELWDDATYENIREVVKPDDYADTGEYEYKYVAENGEDNPLCRSSCLEWRDMRKYFGQGDSIGYGWHITDLVIYREPKALSAYTNYFTSSSTRLCGMLHRPPQSWCYVDREALR